MSTTSIFDRKITVECTPDNECGESYFWELLAEVLTDNFFEDITFYATGRTVIWRIRTLVEHFLCPESNIFNNRYLKEYFTKFCDNKKEGAAKRARWSKYCHRSKNIFFNYFRVIRYEVG